MQNNGAAIWDELGDIKGKLNNGAYYSPDRDEIIDDGGTGGGIGAHHTFMNGEEEMGKANLSGDKAYEFIRDELNDKLLSNEKLMDAKIDRIENSIQHLKEHNEQLVSGLREMLDIRLGHIEVLANEVKQSGNEVKQVGRDIQRWSIGLIVAVIVSIAAMSMAILSSNNQLLTAIISLASK